MSQRIERVLPRVQKATRYMGGEMGSVMKDPAQVRVRYAFLFPDVYEVGMSHLGMKILYHTINKRPDAWCERVFSPWLDMAEEMRREHIPLFSLESRTPVSEFDMLGVTLQYEMSYSNILDALAMAGIPLRSAERTSGPFVIAGGPCAFNPEPLADFFDIFVLGDGEQSTHDTIDMFLKWKESGLPRAEYLKMCAQIPGVYVPSLYDVEYNADGTVRSVTPKPGSGAPERVYKALVNDLNAADFPDQMIVPFGEIVHDRIMLELFRGCTRGCRFCQAGMIYRPVRERSMERLLELADKLIDSTGYEEISLSSLSSGDYSCLPELATELMRRFEKRRVSVTLPSLRVDTFVKDTLAQTQRVKKTTLTFAPEAGSQRLRDVINKGVTEEDLLRSVRDAFESGWSGIKLYTMLGLPTENTADLDGLVQLTRDVISQYFAVPKEQRARGLRVAVSTSTFVPKPHTPFQWEPQDSLDEIERKQRYLVSQFRGMKSVDYKYHESEISFMEACFARGDRRLCAVLENAHKLGCRFDGWHEQFRYDLWLEAFAQAGLDPHFYANRRRAEDEVLPWDHIDAGVTKEFLLREKHRAERGETTPDCRGGCQGCGLRRYEGACRE
ncbi:MAG TPA: TIGR03960 family B12-binding radical SAM protein [Candidatus Fimadaptatus faecigallinarum]|uniref:TIGR03960 family B12-binding radical SAM protein n=1 Tax=Candidatus Fimadaptatus faecigallinarum TaxID=2840814 RepID=A0A9D1LSF4_9FIRM|nr:TIGR03960 family B12-binding radical SAM protein [Candidatus Fimadaptatus faecigallinarum]